MKQHKYSKNCIWNPRKYAFREFNKHLNSFTKNVLDIIIIKCQDEILNNTTTINNSSYKNLYYLFLLLLLLPIIIISIITVAYECCFTTELIYLWE